MDNAAVDIGPGSRALVTGGLGFVGSHLVEHLIARGAEVTVLDVSPPAHPLPAGAGYRSVDLRDPASCRAALVPVDVVFHLAGNASGTISVDHPRFDFETNADGTFNLFEALLSTDVRRVVYLSSAMVYGRPQSHPIAETHPLNPFLPYAASKLSGEHVASSMVESYGLPAVVGRAFTIYGPREDPRRAGGEVSQFLRWHLNGLPIPVVGDPEAKTRDFSHVADLVAGLITIAERGTSGDCYNLGTGTETSMRELVRVIGEVTGVPAQMECDRTVLDDTYRHVADISRLRALGYSPKVALADGISSLAALLGDHPELPAVPTVFQREVPATAPAGV